MVLLGAMTTMEEIADMTTDQVKEYLKSLEDKNKETVDALNRQVDVERAQRLTAEYALNQQRLAQSQHSSGIGPSAGSGTTGQNMMLVSGRHSQPPNLNEATSYDGWLKRFTLWEKNCGYGNDKIASLLIESLGNTTLLAQTSVLSQRRKNLNPPLMMSC